MSLSPLPYAAEVSTTQKVPGDDAGATLDVTGRLIAKPKPFRWPFCGIKVAEYKNEWTLLKAGEHLNPAKIVNAVTESARIDALASDRFRKVLHKVFGHAKPGDSAERVDNAISFVDVVLAHGGEIKAFDNLGKMPLMLAHDKGWLAHPSMMLAISRHTPNVEQLLQGMAENVRSAQAVGANNLDDRLHRDLHSLGLR